MDVCEIIANRGSIGTINNSTSGCRGTIKASTTPDMVTARIMATILPYIEFNISEKQFLSIQNEVYRIIFNFKNNGEESN